MRFFKRSVGIILMAGLLAGEGFANEQTPRSVGEPKVVVKPLLDLGAELKGKATSITSKPEVPLDVRPDFKQPRVQVPVLEDKPDAFKPSSVIKPSRKLPWSYFGATGPQNWTKLSPEYSLCGSGKNQSPINLVYSKAVGTTGLKGFDVHYREAVLRIVNTGRTIKVNYPAGSYINIGKQRFDLLHYRFHTPSEHQINGVNFPMEMQLVHRDSNGNIAVIVVIFQEGAENEFLEEMMMVLPARANQQRTHTNIKVNPARFFPRNKVFLKYNGSLTTPPCSEGVYWMVFKHPVEASYAQLQQMKSIMGANARPVQEINARTLLKSYADRETYRGTFEFF